MIKSRILESLTRGILDISFLSNNLEFCIGITFMLKRVEPVSICLGKGKASIVLTLIIYSCIWNRLAIILYVPWWSYCICNFKIDIIPPCMRYSGCICSINNIFGCNPPHFLPFGISIFIEICLIMFVSAISHRQSNSDLRVLFNVQWLSIRWI